MQTSTAAPQLLAIRDIDHQAVGGKAYGLAKLVGIGLAVPDAFVIINAQKHTDIDGLADFYQSIGGGLVAVRSSAIGEDGVDSSFAGQYETILNVEGMTALKHAINQCVASLNSSHASAYKQQQTDSSEASMCVVVQRMVQPKAAGVLFTADPVSGRHDRLVIDAVAGLGEALVSGEVTPDHYELNLNNELCQQELSNELALLSHDHIKALADGARTASEQLAAQLDMEWAIDADDNLYWLQARPVTTLGTDLNELDTAIDQSDVITRCNVGEMMPGAVCPLTFSVQGRAIEHGMQHMHVCWGVRPAITEEWTQLNLFFGHMFLNMSGGMKSASYVSVNTVETMAQSLCGRPIAELKEPDYKASRWRRWYGSFKFLRYCMAAKKTIIEFEQRFDLLAVTLLDEPKAMIAKLDEMLPWLNEVTEVHLRSSASSGLMEGIVQGIVSEGQRPPTTKQQADAAKLFAGASDVESALLVAHLDSVVDKIADHPDSREVFAKGDSEAALKWLQSLALLQDSQAANAGTAFTEFLARHGHRSYRELCVREQGWIDRPIAVVETMQAALKARDSGNYTPKQTPKINLTGLSRALRWLLPKAHYAIRQREHTKSMMVMTTHRLKRGYRHLGELLERAGHLSDADLVFFLTHDELKTFCHAPAASSNQLAKQRRVALSFHEKLAFDDIYVGNPEPIVYQASESTVEGELIGRPVSLGVVEGYARVATTLSEAAGLQPGEILITPITDVGWTPYFSSIAGLATDVGSAVSHGAVIAREYGLPAVVNLRIATKVFSTGDYVRLDADHGTLSRIDPPNNS
jgi:pyruvate,water dikinase